MGFKVTDYQGNLPLCEKPAAIHRPKPTRAPEDSPALSVGVVLGNQLYQGYQL